MIVHPFGFGTRTRQILRRLMKDWRYSFGITLILGIGIGPAAIGLTVVDRVLLQPLGYEEPDRIGVVRIDVGELVNHPGLAPEEILDLRETEGLFEAVEWATFGPLWSDVGEDVVSMPSANVTPGMFEMLGVAPIIGRSFSEGDRLNRTVILSHETWRTDFGADPEIIGRIVSIATRPHEIVGVLPPNFRFRLGRGSHAPANIDLWRPSNVERYRPSHASYTVPGQGFSWGWNALVRLEDGVSFQQANAALEAFAQREKQTYPEVYGDSRLRFSVSPLLSDLVREARPAILAALVAVVLLLLTATVNASALVVVGQRRRKPELAVRAAIGASRRMLLTDALLESVMLSAFGGALGTGLTIWGVAGLRAVIPRAVPRWEEITFAWQPLLVPLCVASLVLIAVGTVASWWQVGDGPWKSLGNSSDRTSTPRTVGQSILVGFQVVVAVVLLFGAAQLVRSARELARTNLGFEPRGVIAFEVPLYVGLSVEEENARHLQIRDRLAEISGVVTVGGISDPPLRGRGTVNNFTPYGTHPGAAGSKQSANFYAVVPGYFESVGNPILQGRDFTDAETMEGVPVAIIDETLARQAFPGQDPIGKSIGVDVSVEHRYQRRPDPRIIGVVAHSRVIDPTEAVRPQVYLPFGLWRHRPLNFTVCAEGDPRSVIPAARELVREFGVGVPVQRVQILSESLDAETSVLRAVTTLVVTLSLSAAFLSALGLYAVVSYLVIQQRRAIAIRSALGASPGRLLRMQFSRAGVILLAAAPVGVIIAVFGARLLESLVYGVGVRDVRSLVVAAALGCFVGLLAMYIPARRASKADPLVALEVD